MSIIHYHTTAYIDTPREFQNDLSGDGWANSENHTCVTSDQIPDLIEEAAENKNEDLNIFLKEIADTLGAFKGDIVFSYYSAEK